MLLNLKTVLSTSFEWQVDLQ